MFRRRSAAGLFLTLMAFDGVLTRVMWTTYIVFAVVELELDPLQLVLLGTVVEVTYLIFEVPTGVLADTVSRRSSAMETSDIVGRPLREIEFPKDAIVGAIVRGSEVIVPDGSTVIQPGDRVMIFALTSAIKEVEKTLMVKLEYW